MNDAAVNMGVQLCLRECDCGLRPARGRRPDHTATPLWGGGGGDSIPFSTAAVPFMCPPTVHKCSDFSTDLPTPSSALFCLLYNIPYDGRRGGGLTVVWICIFLVMSVAKHLFMCLLAMWKSSVEKCLFKSFAHFLIWSWQ